MPKSVVNNEDIATTDQQTTMPSLEQVIQQTAALCPDVSVTLCRTLGTVTIHDDEGVQDDIFMQGDDADQFIAEFDALIEKAPDVLFDDAIKSLAHPYVECLWN